VNSRMSRSELRIYPDVRQRVIAALAALTIGMGCSESTALNDIDVGLPVRVTDVDTAAVTASLRTSGGNVFVALTGEPTAKALEVLDRAGLMPPVLSDHPTSIVTFPDLHIATVAGYVGAGGVRAIAELRFVTRIEPSGGASLHSEHVKEPERAK
jgi:hypothetical protein